MVANPLGHHRCPFDLGRANARLRGEDNIFYYGLSPPIRKTVFGWIARSLSTTSDLAFRRRGGTFEVYVLESGHGLPSKCNDQTAFGSGNFDSTNPFTPDILVFDDHGN